MDEAAPVVERAEGQRPRRVGEAQQREQVALHAGAVDERRAHDHAIEACRTDRRARLPPRPWSARRHPAGAGGSLRLKGRRGDLLAVHLHRAQEHEAPRAPARAPRARAPASCRTLSRRKAGSSSSSGMHAGGEVEHGRALEIGGRRRCSVQSGAPSAQARLVTARWAHERAPDEAAGAAMTQGPLKQNGHPFRDARSRSAIPASGRDYGQVAGTVTVTAARSMRRRVTVTWPAPGT